MRINLLLVVAVLLLTQSCVPATGQKRIRRGPVDLSGEVSVGTTEQDGSVLQIFALGDNQFAEPSIRFEQSCPLPEFNIASLQYEMSLPISINTKTLKQPTGNESKVANVTISDVDIKAKSELAQAGWNQIRVQTNLLDSGKAEFRISCEQLERCRQIIYAMQRNPRLLQQSFRISARGRVGRVPVKFPNLAFNVAPKLIKCDDWIPFLRRVNSDFSFVRSWDEYERGFGSPDFSHYWMGLEALHQATSRVGVNCSVKFEATDSDAADKVYWEEYENFKVASKNDSYKLILGDWKEHSGHFRDEVFKLSANHSFSTYDRDNDGNDAGHCSVEEGGSGGWWFNQCSYVCLTCNPMKLRVSMGKAKYVKVVNASVVFKCSSD